VINPFNKSIDDVEFSDLENFIEQRIPESLTLDYKGDILQTGNLPQAREFGKDVSSFTNTAGGWLIYGVATNEADEVLPIEENPIVGIENQNGLRENIENRILSTVSPKPFMRIKKIDIPDTERCCILIYVPQSYNHLHMVVGRRENRFYKRHEFSSVPMNYYEIKSRMDEIGQSERQIKSNIETSISKILYQLPRVNNENKFILTVVPKILNENYFDNRELIEQFYSSNRELYLNKYGKTPKRRSDRFIIDLDFYEGNDENRQRYTMMSLNLFYNGIIIQVMPIDLFEETQVNASAICFHVFNFLTATQILYSLFSYDSIIDINFQLNGINEKELVFITRDSRSFWNTSFIFDEEIDPLSETIEISELESQKIDICEKFVLPLYYNRNLEQPIGLFNGDGTPMYHQ